MCHIRNSKAHANMFKREFNIFFLSPAPDVLTQALSTITFSGRSNLVRRSLEKRRKKYKLKKEIHQFLLSEAKCVSQGLDMSLSLAMKKKSNTSKKE
jgi:hypothetical protein